MFRNCYEGISPNEHLKQKTENPTVPLHDEENKLFRTFRRGELSFSLGSVVQEESEKVPCSPCQICFAYCFEGPVRRRPKLLIVWSNRCIEAATKSRGSRRRRKSRESRSTSMYLEPQSYMKALNSRIKATIP